ncbi:cytochrome b5 reductase 4 isoform X2 [Maniola hyperantus]|uniref:cytochrome b5 reductase 4 isoform X2 n=1 Tax=Aphantopus hyperantus TaxID=2795564 RepID=UPI001569E49B|nr:cytochrome b5 reductase 4 isoform X3 [Maniola hyperantus]
MPCCGCWWNGRQRHRPPDNEAGNPRNKCVLQPGHSLMDWIRLGNSGKDLTGVGGRIRPVTPAELAAHSTQKDAWLAIRGRVYNISHYLAYHPGGPEELMRGAGIDATELFDKIHPWVNYDSLLAKCLVGPLRFDRPDAEELFDITNPSPKSDRLREPSKAQELVRKSMENLANCITPVRKKITAKSEENVKGSPPSKIMQSLIQSSDLPVSISRRAGWGQVETKDKSKDLPSPLRFDWIQTSAKLTISIYTGPLVNPGGSARITDGVLFIEVATNGWLRTIKLVPEEALKEPLQLRVYSESGKVEVIALKAASKVWKNIGETTYGAAVPISSPRSVNCRVMHVERVSHDTTLLALCPETGPVLVPLGYHVRVHHRVNDKECVRSYTPVGDHWDRFGSDLSALKLTVKRYDTGALSPHLADLRAGDSLTLSGPYGNFQLQKLKQVKIIYLIAAGTGITPMLGLIKFMLTRSNPRCERVHLLFFNKTEEDILFREHFEEIAKQDERLNTIHILSTPTSSWTGYEGRIKSEILSKVITNESVSREEKPHFACVCGPTEFTHTAIDLLKSLGVKEDYVHAFIG